MPAYVSPVNSESCVSRRHKPFCQSFIAQREVNAMPILLDVETPVAGSLDPSSGATTTVAGSLAK